VFRSDNTICAFKTVRYLWVFFLKKPQSKTDAYLNKNKLKKHEGGRPRIYGETFDAKIMAIVNAATRRTIHQINMEYRKASPKSQMNKLLSTAVAITFRHDSVTERHGLQCCAMDFSGRLSCSLVVHRDLWSSFVFSCRLRILWSSYVLSGHPSGRLSYSLDVFRILYTHTHTHIHTHTHTQTQTHSLTHIHTRTHTHTQVLEVNPKHQGNPNAKGAMVAAQLLETC
jgi:hypothetical protein